MYKVLIADDEYLSRYAFRTIVERNLPDLLEITGEAANGREAVEMAGSLSPDFVIMDIHMPLCDGLQASEEILKECPDTLVFMISAYNEFDYVQRALELGAKAYFLKPFQEEEIEASLRRAAELLRQREEHRSKRDQMEENLSTIRSIIHRDLVKSYINGISNSGSVTFYQSFFHYEIEQGYFLLVILKDYKDSLREDSITFTLFREKILRSVSESLSYLCFHMVGGFILNYIPVFIPVGKFSSYEKEAVLIGRELLRKLRYHRLAAAVSIGTVKAGMENFQYSYQEALSLVNSLEAGAVELASDISQAAPVCTYPYPLESLLTEALRRKDPARGKEISREMIGEIIGFSCDLEQKKEFVAQFFASLKHIVYTLGFDMEPFNSKWPFSACAYLETEEELQIFCLSYVDDFFAVLLKQMDTPNHRLIRKINQYVMDNLTGAISLEGLADYLGFTAQYVSRIFKEEYSQTFIEYVTWKRIELAKEYLASTTKNIMEISRLVGYQDQNYFCRVFKKTTGMTPKEYKLVAGRNPS